MPGCQSLPLFNSASSFYSSIFVMDEERDMLFTTLKPRNLKLRVIGRNESNNKETSATGMKISNRRLSNVKWVHLCICLTLKH
ncbi:Uncharacterized protein APZ42_016860 [Daphnia magna]|uniref:Uncharacterized protein n=1 Tax=Daphnia magna TaxID=35525 RepID=A0A165A6X5_9CRUS|nr:Uncharacterized protein APZ42_016860 [Daphnia magna]